MTDTPQTEQSLPPVFDAMNLESIDYGMITNFITDHGIRFLTALAIFVIGKWIAKRIVNIIKAGMEKTDVDETLTGFLGNIVYGVALAFVVVAALAQMGIETTSLAAVIGAAGLAVGLALQGSLSNFAAGVLIILFRPFKAGDYVEVGGVGGTVEEISIFTTVLSTPDNRQIIMPNGNITNGTIVNYSAKPKRRIDLVIGVAYDADLKKAHKIFNTILAGDDRVLKTPAPTVAVSELGASSVDFVVRPWVKSKDYWATRFDLTEKIKVELDKAGIGIPFPQRDVNLFIRDGDVPAIKTTKKATKKAA